MTDLDLWAMLASWRLHLRAARKAKATIKSYTTGVTQFLEFCEAESVPAVLDKSTVDLWIATITDRGAEATTAASRQLAVRRFSAWITEEDDLPIDPLLGMKAPKLDEKITPRLTDQQCVDLIKACKGKTFRDRRDEAIVRFMLDAIVRAGEVVALDVTDVDLESGRAAIRRGKGGKGRIVPFSPQTALAIDRYLRLRRAHRLADSSRLWLGDRGTGFGYDGLWVTLKWRAGLAGIANFHPHLTRHTAAQRWRAAGGSEEGLMAVGGWKDRATMDRYTRATSSDRAISEAQRLNLEFD
jgi:site-specific recombinase XerD